MQGSGESGTAKKDCDRKMRSREFRVEKCNKLARVFATPPGSMFDSKHGGVKENKLILRTIFIFFPKAL